MFYNIQDLKESVLQGLYVFYLELITDMLNLIVYIVFFGIVFANYGLPLHLVRFAAFFSTFVFNCLISCHR